METISLDEENNLVLKNGSLQKKEGVEALAQDIKTAVGLYRGENRFDISEGIDYDNDMLGKFAGREYYSQAIRNRIEGVEEVEGVKRVDVTFEGRVVKIDADVKSVYGDLKV